MNGKRSQNRAGNTSCQPNSPARPAQGRAEAGPLRRVHRHRLRCFCAMPIRRSSLRRCCTGTDPVELEKDPGPSARAAIPRSIRLHRTPPRAGIMRTHEAPGRHNRSGKSKAAWRLGSGGFEDGSFLPGGAMTTSKLRTSDFGASWRRPPGSMIDDRAGVQRINVALRQPVGGARSSGYPSPEPCLRGAADPNKTDTGLR